MTSQRRDLVREAAAVAAASLALGFTFCIPLMRHLGTIGVHHDWDFSLELDWVPYWTVVHFHQFPLWNPYKCGGMPMLGNPQSRILTPFFLLHLLVGPLLGLHLEIPLHFALAWGGGYLLARVLNTSRLAAAASATIFPASSWYWLHVSEGHEAMALAFGWTPWVIAFAILAADRRRLSYAALAGAALAMTFLEGQPYPATYTAVLLVSVMLPLATMRLSRWPLLALAATCIFAAAFSAPKLLPAWQLLSSRPRLFPDAGDNHWDALWPLLFSRHQDLLRASFNGWGFWESGAYLGLFALPAALGIASLRRSIPWIVAALVSLLMFRGDAGPHSLWTLTHQLPIFSSMRLPSRWLIAFVFAAGVLAGFGFDLIRRIFGRFGSGVAAAIAVVGALDCMMVGTPQLNYLLQEPLPSLSVSSAPFRQYWEVAINHQTRINLANDGVVRCYDYEDWPTPVLGYDQSGYRGEQYLLGRGTVLLHQWTPNALAYDVSAEAPTALVLNQNYDSSWRIREGEGEIFSQGGLLAIRVPAGKQRVEIEYHDRAALIGTAIFSFGMIAAILLWLREHRGKSPCRIASPVTAIW